MWPRQNQHNPSWADLRLLVEPVGHPESAEPIQLRELIVTSKAARLRGFSSSHCYPMCWPVPSRPSSDRNGR